MAAGRVTYTPPKTAWADAANGREIRQSLTQVGGKAAEWMRSVAPVDTGAYKTGSPTAGGFHVRPTTSAQITTEGPGGVIETAAVEVVNLAPYAVYVERGNGTPKFRGYHIFRRCLERLAQL